MALSYAAVFPFSWFTLGHLVCPKPIQKVTK